MKFTQTWLQSQISWAINNGDVDYLTDLIVRFVIHPYKGLMGVKTMNKTSWRFVATREIISLPGGGRKLYHGVWDTKENKLIGALRETEAEAQQDADKRNKYE